MQKVDVLRAACCVAGIDGETTESERAIIEKLGADAGVGRASREAMVERATNDPEFYKEQFRVLKEDPQDSMAALLEVALADGSMSDAELGVMRALSERLNISPELFDQLMTKVSQLLE